MPSIAASVTRNVWLTTAMFLVLSIAFGIYVVTEKQIDRANEQRYASYLLADELRQSSDDLTRMARSYVVTGAPHYKKYFQDIADIRDGKMARPEKYQSAYWDLVLTDAYSAPAAGGPAISLLELMRRTGFSEDELRKLSEAKGSSDALTTIERQAMRLVESVDASATAKRAQALSMLHDANYHRTKAVIMQAINECYELMEKRTAASVREAERTAIMLRIVFTVCLLTAMLMLLRTYVALRRTLGGTPDEVHAQMLRIGHGDLAADIAVPPGTENSVLAGLSRLQNQLRTQQTERESAKQALQASEARLHSIFDASPDALLISNAQGIIVMANQQTERLLGYTIAELIDQSVDTLVPERSRAHHPALRDEFTALPSTRRMGHGMEVTTRRKDGSECDVEIRLSQIQTDRGTFVATSLRDVTERKQAEDRVHRLTQLYAALSSCNQAIVRCTSEAELFPEICRDVVIFGGMKMAWIGLIDESSRRVQPVAAHGAGHEYVADVQISINADDPLGQGPTGIAVRENQPVWCQDFLGDTRTVNWHEHARRFDLAASAALPLHCNGKTVGSFNLYAGAINAFDEDTRKLLIEMAVDISFALDNFAREASRKIAEAALRESEERYRAYIEQAADAIFVHDFNGKFIDVNQQACASLGYSRAELVNMSVSDVETDFDLAQAQAAWSQLHPDQRLMLQGHQRRKDGTLFPVEVQFGCFDRDGVRLYMGLVRDISERALAEEQLRIAAAAFDSQEGMLITDANSVVLRVNRAFTEITGYAPEEIVGKTPRLLKSGRHNPAFYREMWQTLARTGVWQGEIWDRRKNGEIYPKWLTISTVRNANGDITHYVGTHFDISERKQAEAKINELAFFDQLTGLPNRTLLHDRLKQTMTAGTRSGSFAALLLIDLDNFKTLNDTLGHDMGDMLLKQVAQRLTGCVRAEDTVARLGGDEFMVMLVSLSASPADAAAQTEAVTEKILSALNRPYPLGEVAYLSTPSIGVTLFKGHLATIDDLMKQVDLAMYKSKATGRNQIRFFDPAMETAVMARAELEKDLRRALDNKQFVLHYQPQIAGENQLTGAEALVRWQHPQRGMVAPAQFIPLAEETGLILPLGHWVLETACAQLALWATRPEMTHLSVAVNVSAQQFRVADFVDQVLAVIGSTGANPHRLKLELTESLLVDNVEDIIEKMFMLKARGVGFSLDDFGTGYSSLSYLKRLPLDQLKIDQSFVRDVLNDPNDAAIARTVVALAQSLGLAVIAEGVETGAQRDFLARSGCHAYQGYFFSRPLPLAGFEEFAQRTGVAP